jgi:hypothetical protein
MDFRVFIRKIHAVIRNKSLYEFTIDLFDEAADNNLYLTIDMVKNWFKSSKKYRSYEKIFNDQTFNDIRFNTFLKAITLGKWRTLQTTFNVEINKHKIESVIDCTTDNHDKFIESIEWQFKTILCIPVPIADNQEHIIKNVNPDENAIIYEQEHIKAAIKREKAEIAKNFYRIGLTIEKISEGMKISTEEVKNMIESNL